MEYADSRLQQAPDSSSQQEVEISLFLTSLGNCWYVKLCDSQFHAPMTVSTKAADDRGREIETRPDRGGKQCNGKVDNPRLEDMPHTAIWPMPRGTNDDVGGYFLNFATLTIINSH